MEDKPELQARAEIDRLLKAAGWSVQPVKEADIQAERGAIAAFRNSYHSHVRFASIRDDRGAGTTELAHQRQQDGTAAA